jgi:hypothetical protein
MNNKHISKGKIYENKRRTVTVGERKLFLFISELTIKDL